MNEMDPTADDSQILKMKKNNNVKSIDFDLFYELVKDRNSGISRDILRDILETLPNDTKCISRQNRIQGRSAR